MVCRVPEGCCILYSSPYIAYQQNYFFSTMKFKHTIKYIITTFKSLLIFGNKLTWFKCNNSKVNLH